jgi:hypothetical protein
MILGEAAREIPGKVHGENHCLQKLPAVIFAVNFT